MVLRYLFWLWLDISILIIPVTQVTPTWHGLGCSPHNNVLPPALPPCAM